MNYVEYPIGVLMYTRHIQKIYESRRSLYKVCDTFGITESLLMHTVAEASHAKLLREHEVELTSAELIVTITDTAVAVFLMEHMDEVQVSCVDGEGRLDWSVPKHLADKLSGIAAIAIDIISKN